MPPQGDTMMMNQKPEMPPINDDIVAAASALEQVAMSLETLVSSEDEEEQLTSDASSATDSLPEQWLETIKKTANSPQEEAISDTHTATDSIPDEWLGPVEAAGFEEQDDEDEDDWVGPLKTQVAWRGREDETYDLGYESVHEEKVHEDVGNRRAQFKRSRYSELNQSKRSIMRSCSDIALENDALAEFSENFCVKKTYEAKSVRHASSIYKFIGSGEWKLNGGVCERFDWLLYCPIPIILQFALGQDFFFPDGRPACEFDGLGLSNTNSSMCELSYTLHEAYFQLRVLVAFILGGFITHTVYLWRTRRTNYCSLCGACRNLIIQISSLIPISDRHDEVMAERKTLERWAILGYELAILKARGEMDAISGEEYLEARHLLASNEWERMVEGDRHTTVWYWIQQKAVMLREKDIIKSEQRLQTICTAVTEIRAKANDLMSCIDRDNPIAYAFLVGLLVKLNILTFVALKGVEWAIWYYDSEGAVWTEPKMYQDAVCSFLYIIIMEMLYDISVVLYNPFGEREMDVPHEIVGTGIRHLAKELGDAKHTRPSTMFSVDKRNGVFLKSVDGMEDVVEFEEQAVCHRTRRQSSIICQRRRSSAMLR